MVSTVSMSHVLDAYDRSSIAAYAIVVRSSEYELSPDMLDDIVERTVTTLSAEGGRGGGGRKRGRENDSDEDD